MAKEITILSRHLMEISRDDVIGFAMHTIESVVEEMCGVKVDADRYYDLENEIIILLDAHLGLNAMDPDYSKKWHLEEIHEE